MELEISVLLAPSLRIHSGLMRSIKPVPVLVPDTELPTEAPNLAVLHWQAKGATRSELDTLCRHEAKLWLADISRSR